MGYTVRTAGFRFTEWHRWNGSVLRPIWSALATELYEESDKTPDADGNFDDFVNSEVKNVAGSPQHQATQQALEGRLCAHFADPGQCSHSPRVT